MLSIVSENITWSKDIGKALSVSVLNQVVSSGTNFLLGLYLVRTLPQADFGLYGIGFAISLFYAGIGNAVFLTQMVVKVPHKLPEDRLPYAARMLAAVVLFCFASGTAALLVLLVGGIWCEWIYRYSGVGLAIAAASIIYLLKDFFLRHAYTIRKEIIALAVNVSVAVALVGTLYIHHIYAKDINAQVALWYYAFCHLVGVAVGLTMLHLPLQAISISHVLSDIREAWSLGRWGLLNNIVSSFRTQAHIVFATAIAGLTTVAKLNATRLLITPAIFFLPAVSQLLLPRLAWLKAQSKIRLISVGFILGLALIAASLIYSMILLIFLKPISGLILGGRYTSSYSITSAWSAYVCMYIAGIGATLILQALHEFRITAVASIVGTIAMIFSVYPLYKAIGVTGIIWAMVVSETVISVILCRQILLMKQYKS